MNPLDLLAHSGDLQGISPAAGVFVFILSIFIIILWLWSLIDTLRRTNFKDSTEKLIWVFVIISTFFLGSILYIFMGRKKK